MDYQQIVRATVTTAVALPPDRVSALAEGLATATGRQVQLRVDVDPAILGGAVARIGSTVYDGSITTPVGPAEAAVGGIGNRRGVTAAAPHLLETYEHQG